MCAEQIITKEKKSQMVRRSCPVCNRTDTRAKWDKPGVVVDECTHCSMFFVRDVPDEFASTHFYKESSYHLQADKLESDYSPVRFERELRLFHEFCAGGSVLDIGCSTGGFLYQLTNHWPCQYNVTGMDVSGAALEYASSKGISVIAAPFLTHDFAGKKFDAVMFWAVLEHLAEPGLYLARAADLLMPGGHCFLLVPNARSLAIRLLG